MESMTFEKRAWILIDAFILCLVLVSTRLVYWQLVRGEDLLPVALGSGQSPALKSYTRGNEEIKSLLSGGSLDNPQDLPQPVVQRLSDFLETIQRGSIYDRNGRLLASDRLDPSGKSFRLYTEPSLAQVIGSVSGLGLGISGLEKSYNEALLGLDRADAGFQRMLHQSSAGSDLTLTIDSSLQRTAEQALEGRAGSITVLDGYSGAILAMASLPRFDPNRILEKDYLVGLLQDCDGSPQCSGPLLNRATQALYPPGSTWKTVTLIAALDSGQISPDAVFDFGQPVQGPDGPYYIYKVGGGVIPDPNHAESKLSLEMSYAKSANAAFARIGDEMPPETLIDYAARLGFSASKDQRFPLEFDYSPSQLAQNVNSLYDNSLLRAATAIGQGELQVSPLNMGMVVLSVLNEGSLPLPYLVQRIHDPQGSPAGVEPERAILQGILKPETAQLVRKMMESVVTQGSGRKAAIQGMVVGGKTGTAQVGGNLQPHAWFMGFAQQGDRSVVVVVMIENGGEGSQVAAPVFAQIAEAALNKLGEPVPEVVPSPLAPVLTPTSLATEAGPEAALTPVSPTPEATLDTTASAVPTPLAGAQPTPTAPAPTPASIEGAVPPPDIPYQSGKVDFTEQGSGVCPGNQTGTVGSGKFMWPSVYQGLSGDSFREGHPGIDLSAPIGTPVYASDGGLVTFAGWTGIGYGNAVVIDHGNGYKTLYGHLSQVSQYCGAKVKAGQLIGLSGSTGNSSGPHLHFEVRVPGGYLDPLKVLPTP
jgi:peptidoglycan glycosyltransferase